MEFYHMMGFLSIKLAIDYLDCMGPMIDLWSQFVSLSKIDGSCLWLLLLKLIMKREIDQMISTFQDLLGVILLHVVLISYHINVSTSVLK